jgi:uncharacterized membrane protein
MHPNILATFPGIIFLEFSRLVTSMCAAGLVLFVISLLVVKSSIAQARGLDKVLALSNMFFAMPLAVFASEHFADTQSIMGLVPTYMPWRLFWVYFVGVGLIAASLSIATKILVQWSGLLFGIMMFLFTAMLTIPAIVANPHERISWVLVFREPSFGSGAWCLASLAMVGGRTPGKSKLVTVGRVIIGIAALFYSIQQFLHPINVPGIPLEKLMPTWIPGRVLISYVTGVILLVAGASILLNRKTRKAATYLGTWIIVLVVFVYGPILITSLLDPNTATKVEGLNYFFDTMLYGGAILGLARAVPSSE